MSKYNLYIGHALIILLFCYGCSIMIRLILKRNKFPLKQKSPGFLIYQCFICLTLILIQYVLEALISLKYVDFKIYDVILGKDDIFKAIGD